MPCSMCLRTGLNVIYQNAPAFHRSAAYVTFSVLLRYFHKFKGDLNNVAHPALGAFIATLNRVRLLIPLYWCADVWMFSVKLIH